MSESSHWAAQNFLEHEQQFHLGFLPTEQSSPLTRHLDAEFARSSVAGVANLQSVDRNVLTMARRMLQTAEFEKLVACGEKVLRQGGKMVFSGCGATGRLSILLESMWRQAAARIPELKPYANSVFSIMTGGDYALVKAVEFFEDYQEFGRRQVQELGLDSRDMLVAITEGGETSSVLGTLFEALERQAQGFLLFNNPANLLAQHLERSRQAITDPRVTVLDLSCGPMALAGSTRMQATTSEQLIAGAALEKIIARLLGQKERDVVEDFARLLDELEAPAAQQALADYLDFEVATYREKGLITYFAHDFLLDIFTDTTERSPTFMLPPFRNFDDDTAPDSWAFVKDPLYDTPTTWQKSLLRSLRCLEWQSADYVAMHAPQKLAAQPPQIQSRELLKIQIGNENPDSRARSAQNRAVLITVGGAPANAELMTVFKPVAKRFAGAQHLAVGGDCRADFLVPCTLPDTPLQLMGHMAIKLALNTISTGTMAQMGRVTGNWMSWVACTNKKLIDRAIRLISEIGGLDYAAGCEKIFEAIEILQNFSGEKPSPVQYVLNSLKK